MGELLFKNEVYAIIGCAIEVRRTLGPGFLEGGYGDALAVEFRREEIPFTRESKFPVTYKGSPRDRRYVPDLVCYSQIVVELKAIDFLSRQCESQLLNYLKGTGLRLGLLINFGSHGKLEWKRMIL
jgi:GxxExxY protein